MSKKVLVIGELNVDLIITGLSSLPMLGRELTCTGFARALGSSSAIFARALAGLGAEVDFMGKVGDDDNGRFMIAQLQEVGIGVGDVIVDPGLQTGVTISLTYPQEKAQVTYPGSIAGYHFSEVNLAALANYSHLHLASMFLQTGLQPDFPRLLRQARSLGLTTSLDPGWDPADRWSPVLFEALAEADILFVNEHEARAIAGRESIAEALAALAQRVDLAVVKLGADGARLAGPEGVLACPAWPMTVVDTTGAGDSFDAGFIYKYIVTGGSLAEALHFANACGAIAVTRVGGASSVPGAAEVETLLSQEAGE